MSIDCCSVCSKHVDTDFHPEFYREEYAHEGLCDGCYERRLEESDDTEIKVPTMTKSQYADKLMTEHELLVELENVKKERDALLAALNKSNEFVSQFVNAAKSGEVPIVSLSAFQDIEIINETIAAIEATKGA